MTETKGILIMPNPDEVRRNLQKKMKTEKAIHPERFGVGQFGKHTGQELDENAKRGRSSTQAGHIGEALDDKE